MVAARMSFLETRSGVIGAALALTVASMFGGSASADLLKLKSTNQVDFGLFGSAVAGIPDVDGDGFGDVIVGAVEENGGGENQSGRVYIFSGLAAGTYIVRQIVPSGDTQVSPASNFGQHVTVSSGQASTGNNFSDAG